MQIMFFLHPSDTCKYFSLGKAAGGLVAVAFVLRAVLFTMHSHQETAVWRSGLSAPGATQSGVRKSLCSQKLLKLINRPIGRAARWGELEETQR